MTKIDRLGWAAGISFISHGVRVGVRANSSEALTLAQCYFPPGWTASASAVVERLYSFIVGANGGAGRGARRFHLLYANTARLARTENLDEALDSFESDLHMHVAAEAPRRVFVHAGVVGWRGQAVLLPGRSYSGKTTLVAELVNAGATYYSDEYAVLDAEGRVHPFPRPLQIRDAPAGKQRRYSIEALGGKPGVKPLPVGMIVVSRYNAGSVWRPRRLSDGQGVLELLAHTVSARRRPEKALATLQRAVAGALIVKGVRGEVREMLDSVLSSSCRRDRNVPPVARRQHPNGPGLLGYGGDFR